jgi:hypothetical protein
MCTNEKISSKLYIGIDSALQYADTVFKPGSKLCEFKQPFTIRILCKQGGISIKLEKCPCTNSLYSQINVPSQFSSQHRSRPNSFADSGGDRTVHRSRSTSTDTDPAVTKRVSREAINSNKVRRTHSEYAEASISRCTSSLKSGRPERSSTTALWSTLRATSDCEVSVES